MYYLLFHNKKPFTPGSEKGSLFQFFNLSILQIYYTPNHFRPRIAVE